jgi:NAD(P) transhydrogenase subunit alpha
VFVGYGRLERHPRCTRRHGVTNAISSIIIIGGLIQISDADPLVMWIAGITVTLTAVNITGGFAVTQRMLAMFRK